MQAEAFYQYRFAPLPKSSLSYAAEAAAAITDFPAFQSLAGSIGLQDIRYRSSDVAVQLWESLLHLYPKTSLRPITLYRLGWAYRNVGVTGLPRHNPNEAFDQLIKENPHSKLALLAIEAKKIPWKSKDIATSRSLLPGLGQLYVGKKKSGFIRMGIALASLATIIMPLQSISRRPGGTDFKRDWPLMGLSITGLIGLSFIYTNSYEDALQEVIQWNEKAENLFYHKHANAL
jgi:hypothetical protein